MRSVDPSVYAFAEQLSVDLPNVLRHDKDVLVTRLANALQRAYEDWYDDTVTAHAAIISKAREPQPLLAQLKASLEAQKR